MLGNDALRAIARLCAARNVTILSDGAYRAFCYVGDVPNLPRIAAEAGATCVVVDTLSKAYSMSGWRIGFVAGHRTLITAIAAFQSQTISCPAAVTQVAALAALSGSRGVVAQSVEVFRKRREVLLSSIASLPGIALGYEPSGGFFVFPNFTRYLGLHGRDGSVITDDHSLAAYLLQVAHVSVIPGSAFGAPGYLRLSYTLPEARIREGIERIGDALSALTKSGA